MKKTIFLLSCLLVLALTISAHAEQKIFTFVGPIGVINDPTGVLADQGLFLGTEITLIVLADFDAQGTRTRNDGTVEPAYEGYFFADLIGGTTILPSGTCYPEPWHVAEHNFMWDTLEADGEFTANAYLSSSDVLIHLYGKNYAVPIQEWQEGINIEVNSDITVGGSFGDCIRGKVIARVDLVDIAPVPPPALSGCLQRDGEPLVGASVKFKEKGSKKQTTTTDDDGCFEFDQIEAGERPELVIGDF